MSAASTRADLVGLLEQVARVCERYVVFASEEQVTAVALWIAHTHAIEAADVTMYLAITSPAKRSGKTRLLELLELLVPRPRRTANISDAALFRIIDQERPTLLLDEADVTFGPKSDRHELRGLLNAGYRRGATVIRCETIGRTQKVVPKDAFGAKALAAIGQLPDTISDRSVMVRLQRKASSESVERFRFREASSIASPLREALGTWAQGSLERLREARPNLPEELNDRAQDGWEPLLAIADTAGEGWPARARSAAVALQPVGEHGGGDDLAFALLGDVRRVFEATGKEMIPTRELATQLISLEEAAGPWGDMWELKLQTRDGLLSVGRRIGLLLARLDVQRARPKYRVGPETVQGYAISDLADAFMRYLPPLTRNEPTLGTAVGTAQLAVGQDRSDTRSESRGVPIDGVTGLTDEEALANIFAVFPQAAFVEVSPRRARGEGHAEAVA